MSEVFKLSPSDLTFLWDECPRCFYLKVARGINRPSGPFPKIFTRIDLLMKDFFSGKNASEFSPELPPGRVKFGGKWVESHPITFPGRTHSCYIRGIFDTLVEFSDGTYGVIDFKTSEAKPEHVPFYGRQLQAYAYSLEHPAPGRLSLSPISRLGLLCVEPLRMDRDASGQIAYLGNATWLECPKNDAAFLSFLEAVLSLLEQPQPPKSSPNCEYCAYRDAARRNGL